MDRLEDGRDFRFQVDYGSLMDFVNKLNRKFGFPIVRVNMDQQGIDPANARPQERIDDKDRGTFRDRLDRRARGPQEMEDRLRELQAKPTLTEGERAELHLLLARRWPDSRL